MNILLPIVIYIVAIVTIVLVLSGIAWLAYIYLRSNADPKTETAEDLDAKKSRNVFVWIVVCLVIALIGFVIYQIVMSAPTSSGEQLSRIGVAIVLVLLFATLGIITYQTVIEHDGDWKKISLSPLVLTALIVLVLNLVLAIGLPETWLAIWAKPTFFLLLCSAPILAIHFAKKGYFHVSIGIMIIVAISAYNTYSSNLSLPSWERGGYGGGSGHYAVRELKPGEWSKPPVVNPVGNVTMSWLVTGVTEEDKKECYIRVDNEKIVPLKHDFKKEPRTYESFEFKCNKNGVLVVDVTRN